MARRTVGMLPGRRGLLSTRRSLAQTGIVIVAAGSQARAARPARRPRSAWGGGKFPDLVQPGVQAAVRARRRAGAIVLVREAIRDFNAVRAGRPVGRERALGRDVERGSATAGPAGPVASGLRRARRPSRAPRPPRAKPEREQDYIASIDTLQDGTRSTTRRWPGRLRKGDGSARAEVSERPRGVDLLRAGR